MQAGQAGQPKDRHSAPAEKFRQSQVLADRMYMVTSRLVYLYNLRLF